METAPLPNL